MARPGTRPRAADRLREVGPRQRREVEDVQVAEDVCGRGRTVTCGRRSERRARDTHAGARVRGLGSLALAWSGAPVPASVCSPAAPTPARAVLVRTGVQDSQPFWLPGPEPVLALDTNRKCNLKLPGLGESRPLACTHAG